VRGFSIEFTRIGIVEVGDRLPRMVESDRRFTRRADALTLAKTICPDARQKTKDDDEPVT